MEPIPHFYDNVKRSALVLKPKEPFFDWLVSIESENKEYIKNMEGEVYLLPDYEEISKMQDWLKKHFDKIFGDQLNNWYIDEMLWPQKRTYTMFNEWFEYTLHTMIMDTQNKPIKKL